MQKVCEFLKNAGTYYLATVEGDQPRDKPSLIGEGLFVIREIVRKQPRVH